MCIYFWSIHHIKPDQTSDLIQHQILLKKVFPGFMWINFYFKKTGAGRGQKIVFWDIPPFPRRKFLNTLLNSQILISPVPWIVIVFKHHCFVNRESDITVNENDTSEQQKESVTLSLAYNLIEQFIDSYVVFEWDSEKWIKESLIQYLSYQITHYVSRNWKNVFSAKWNIYTDCTLWSILWT